MIIELNKWILSLGSLLLFIILSFIAAFVLNKIVSITTKKVSLNTKIASALRKPIRLVIILIGIFIANYYLKPDLKIDGINLVVIYQIITIIIFFYALVSIIKTALLWYVENLKEKKKTKIDDTIFNFLTKVSTVILYFIGLLIILDLLKIQIKPILAGLGIAGLAVALALQDTLSNFFSALYIAADQPVKIGDFIELPTGEKGYVTEIGWRSTRLKTRERNIIIIPNSKLSSSILTNYNQIEARFKIDFPVSISYNSNLEAVEKLTIEVASKIMKKLQPHIDNFKPYIRYENFGDNGINFKVSLMAENVEDKYLVMHEFIKELTKVYKKENIDIPYPQRDVHLKK